MEQRSYESLQAKRAEIVEAHRKAMARLDAMEGAHAVAAAVMDEWRGAREGREARIYIGDGAMMVTLTLADGEIFGDAAEIFDGAEERISAAVPLSWAAEWSGVEDTSQEHEAQRQMVLRAVPAGSGYWFYDGFAIWLTVAARVAKGSACQIIKIGERQETYSVPLSRSVPVYKSVCPGDPAPLAAE